MWQVRGCAAACAFGSTLGLIVLTREFAYHVLPPTWALGQAGAATCAGVIAGLWAPRAIIRRRTSVPSAGTARRAAAAGGPRHADATVEPGFAAALSGLLILALGMVWLLLCGWAAGMEAYRGFLAQRFLFPPALTQTLLVVPAWLGFTVAGAATTLALVGLHGWHRLVALPPASLARLWTPILIAALAAGIIALRSSRPWTPAIAALLAVFLAGILAAFRRPGATPLADPPQAPRPRAASEYVPLAAVGLATVSVGVASVLAVPDALPDAPELGLICTVMAGAAAVGLLVGRVWLRVSAGGSDIAAWPLLAPLVAWVLPLAPTLGMNSVAALIRLGLITGGVATGIVVVGRRVATTARSAQYAVACVGTAVAGGFGLAALGGPALIGSLGAELAPVLMLLLSAAAIALVMLLDRAARRPIRLAALTGAAVCVVILALAYGGTPSSSSRARVAEQDGQQPAIVRAARDLLRGGGLHTACVQPEKLAARRGGLSGWQLDLAGRQWDTIIVQAPQDGSPAEWLRRPAGRRLLRRCTAALLVGGRIVIELPAGQLERAAFDSLERADPHGPWQPYVLRVAAADSLATEDAVLVPSDDHAYRALVLGADVPAWLAQRPVPSGLDVALFPVQERSELRVAQAGSAADR